MDEALSKCRSWTPPQASSFTHTECGVINTDNGSHWKQHMAIMQTVDVLVGAHRAVALCPEAAGTRRGWPSGSSYPGAASSPRGELLEHRCLWLPVRTEGRCKVSLVMRLLLDPQGCPRQWPEQWASHRHFTFTSTGRHMQAPQGLAWWLLLLAASCHLLMLLTSVYSGVPGHPSVAVGCCLPALHLAACRQAATD